MAKKGVAKPKEKKANKGIVDLRRAPQARPPCWLVWSLQTSGLTQLRAIDTSPKCALQHKKMCDGEHWVIRAWVEQRDMNHLYGHDDLTEFQIMNRTEFFRVADALRADKGQ